MSSSFIVSLGRGNDADMPDDKQVADILAVAAVALGVPAFETEEQVYQALKGDFTGDIHNYRVTVETVSHVEIVSGQVVSSTPVNNG